MFRSSHLTTTTLCPAESQYLSTGRGMTNHNIPCKIALAVTDARRPIRCPEASMSICWGNTGFVTEQLSQNTVKTHFLEPHPWTSETDRPEKKARVSPSLVIEHAQLESSWTLTLGILWKMSAQKKRSWGRTKHKEVTVISQEKIEETLQSLAEEKKQREVSSNVGCTISARAPGGVESMDLQYPELMSNDTLVAALKRIKVPIPVYPDGSPSRERLLYLFKTNVLPRPQRNQQKRRRGLQGLPVVSQGGQEVAAMEVDDWSENGTQTNTQANSSTEIPRKRCVHLISSYQLHWSPLETKPAGCSGLITKPAWCWWNCPAYSEASIIQWSESAWNLTHNRGFASPRWYHYNTRGIWAYGLLGPKLLLLPWTMQTLCMLQSCILFFL